MEKSHYTMSPTQLNSQDLNYAFSELHRDVITGNRSQLSRHLENCNDVNQRDGNSFTPLHLAVLLKKNELVELLVSNCQADVNVKTLSGQTPLHLAAFGRGKLDILRYLIERGCDVNTVDSNESTPLHLAVKTAAFEAVVVLLEEGCDHNLVDKKGRSAKDIAIENKNLDLINIITEHEERVLSKEDQQSAFSALTKQRPDLRMELHHRSSSILSSIHTLAPILEDDGGKVTLRSDGETNNLDRNENKPGISSPALFSSSSMDSVFSFESKSNSFEILTDDNNNNDKDSFIDEKANFKVAISEGASDNEMSKQDKTPPGNKTNNPYSNAQKKIILERQRKFLRRTMSHDSATMPISFNNERNNDHLSEAEKTTLSERPEKIGNFFQQRTTRSNSVALPRSRKLASLGFWFENVIKDDDTKCDEDILSLLKTKQVIGFNNENSVTQPT